MELYELHLYEMLRTKLGEQEASALVKQIEHTLQETSVEPRNLVANKEDIAMLKADITNAKIEILRWVLALFITLILAVLGLYIS